jgi:dephospho-CoA kinase
MLVGMVGKAGSGKDTVGDYLIKNYGFNKIALADPIKRLVKDIFVLDDHTVYDRVAREQPLEKWPNWTVRKLLQYIGTELFRNNIDEAIWVKSLWYKIQEDRANNYIISDVRFENEQKYFKDNAKEGEFVCIKVIRPGYNGNVGIKMPFWKSFLFKIIGKDIRHASEAYDLQGDFEIINDGTIEDLYNKVDIIAKNFLKEKINEKL